jgi:hypothetical protein
MLTYENRTKLKLVVSSRPASCDRSQAFNGELYSFA